MLLLLVTSRLGGRGNATNAVYKGPTHGQGTLGSGPGEAQEGSQPPPGPLKGLSEWSGPTRIILVAQGAQELPRQFTEPRDLENADNADLELSPDRGDLGLIQGNLRKAPNRHQDPSRDSQNGQFQPGSFWWPKEPGSSHANSRSLGAWRTPTTPTWSYPRTGETWVSSRGTSGTLPTATRTPHGTPRMVRSNQVHFGGPRSPGAPTPIHGA